MIDLIEYNDLPYMYKMKIKSFFIDKCNDQFDRMGLVAKGYQIHDYVNNHCYNLRFYNNKGHYYKVEMTLI